MRFAEHIQLLKRDYSNHSHWDITCRVLECLDYIEENLEAISKHAGQAELLRHPTNHLAFHLHDMKTPEEVKTNFTRLIAETRGCLEQMSQIPEPEIRRAITDVFLLNINDSPVGCMEVRLRSALEFFAFYQANGCMHINNVMQQFQVACNGNITVVALLDFFSQTVEHHLPVKDMDGVIKPLDWTMIKNYVRDTFGIDSIEQDWLHAIKTLATPVITPQGRWYHFYFTDRQAAERYLSYVKSMLPDSFQSDLAKAAIKDDKQNGYTFRLSNAQYQTLQQSFIREPTPKPHPEKKPSPLINLLKSSDVVAKTIRFDGECFLPEFVEGIIPDPTQEKQKFPLRTGPHKEYAVDGTGFYQRKVDKPSPYGLAPDQLKIEKSLRSQPQSVSLITPEKNSPVFGHNRDRRDKLAGYLFLAKDGPLYNRYFRYDSGTIKRPYEFDTKQAAERYYREKVKSANPVLFPTYDAWRAAYVADPVEGQYYEGLARIAWQQNKSCVGVFSDTFEARCIAQYYAETTNHRLKRVALSQGASWNDTDQVPIVNYLPKHPNKHWTDYTSEEQKQDRKEALAILQDPVRSKAAIDAGNPEFLLLLDDPYAALSFIDQLQEKKLYHVLMAIITRCTHTEPVNLKQLDRVANWFTSETFQHILRKDRSLFTWLAKNKMINLETDLDRKMPLLTWAAFYGHAACLKTLVSLLDIDKYRNEVHSALITAAEHGYTACVQALVSNPNIDLNFKLNHNDRILNALIYAAENGHTACVKTLLSHPNIDPNIKNHNGDTALMLAVKYNRIDCVQALAAHPDVDLSIKNIFDHNPIMNAWDRRYAHTEIIRILAISMLNHYLTTLENREEEFKPRSPFLSSFFNNPGYSKSEKKQAAERCRDVLEGKPNLLSEKDISALKNGRLWNEIIFYVPKDLYVPRKPQTASPSNVKK